MPPPTFALIIGDVVHNLRTALDHANWELRGQDGGKQDRYTKLPVGDDKTKFESQCHGIRTPRGDLPSFYIPFEFFNGGKGHNIFVLHDLDIIDKHMILSIVGTSLLFTPRSDGPVILEVKIPGPSDRTLKKSKTSKSIPRKPLLSKCVSVKSTTWVLNRWFPRKNNDFGGQGNPYKI